nr:5-aminolevulinic acid dehydratase, Alv-D, porphobilinogen synthase {N-terminal} {EC 4.2.1.24} [Scenedesmus obliquus=unicellular green algae, C-2A', Peptide Mutant, 15 aa] [Tetradesmus obliquus]
SRVNQSKNDIIVSPR